MDMPFTFENAVVQRQASYISPERLTTLKNIFESVCDEAAIPVDATGDRNALATKILVTSETIESEMMLVLAAMQTAMDGRR
jgi:hypothetical protein